MNSNTLLNTTEVATGKDGELYCTVPGLDDEIFLAEVNDFSTVMNVQTQDAQPVGHLVVGAVPTGVTFELTYTEMMVRDDLSTEPILAALAQGHIPVYSFRGKIKKPLSDDNYQSIVYNSAIPAGQFDLQVLKPGEIVQRQHTFRLNEIPKLLKKMASAYLPAVA